LTTHTLTRQLILGTAGHIDHGKTALVHALTGVDTDRLPEEKKRGMTIDIGFASLNLGDVHLGIVDVPGHERFIKNMLAGAAGIDVALFIVAADDSVMPQTREHLDILQLLDIRAGIIVITKTDLSDPDWLDLVEEEVRELVKGTFLEDAPIVRTSVKTGDGIDTLKQTLSEVCSGAASRKEAGLFRLAVDRAFTLQGHGTIVTGTVWSGKVSVGDVLDWHPKAKTVRVRSLESHDQEVQHIEQGQRAAIGLTGVHHSEIVRGDEIAVPGYLFPSKCMTAHLHVLKSSPWPIKHRARVRLHIGSREVIARISLLTCDTIAPGQSADVQFTLAEAATATCGQPFVIRSESPLITLGGGHILQPVARRIRKRQTDLIDRLNQLISVDPIQRADTATYFFGLNDWTDLDLCRDANIAPEMASDLPTIDVSISPTRCVRLHKDIHDKTTSRLIAAIKAYHQAHPLHAGMPHQQLATAIGKISAAILRGMIAQLISDGTLQGNEHAVLLEGFTPKLNQAQENLLANIISAYDNANYQPPDADELVDDQSTPAMVRQLIDLAAGQGSLVHLGSGLYLHAKHERAMREKIADRLNHVSGMTVAQIRDLLGTSRKFAVPICEYLDRIGCTRRSGDVRIAGVAKD